MARLRRGGGGEGLNPWPGYVDALSTLLMVIIFVLLVFVLAQAFLSVSLSGRTQAMERLRQQVAELSSMLSLQQGQTTDLRAEQAQVSRDLRLAVAQRDTLTQQLAALQAEDARVTAERDTLRAEHDQLAAQLATTTTQLQQTQQQLAQIQALAEASTTSNTAAEAKAATAVADLARNQAELGRAQADLARIQAELARTQADLAASQAHLDAMRQQAQAADQTIQTDRATLEAKLSDLARLSQQVQALSQQVQGLAALRDQLERQAQDAAVRATTEQQRRQAVAAQLADQQKLADSDKAQIALMTQQVQALRDQFASVQAALGTAQNDVRAKDIQIADLGQRLNVALAQKVQELQRYRSEFFGKLSQILANRPGIAVVGDRFVFQSEVLFPPGSDQLNDAGRDELTKLAGTLKDIVRDIPPDVNWILRVDGHADKQPVDQFGPFTDNWDLSAKRAINVVKLLIADGVPANHLAATAFADNQPLDPADTPQAFAKNRRIEIRLTDR